MIEIRLTQGKVALVDDDCPIHILEMKWHCSSFGYARHTINYSNAKKEVVYLHRLIIDAKKGMQVDHINQDKLDNRKENLRLCNFSQNQANTSHRKNKSGYRGVSLKKSGRYISLIRFDNKTIYLGLFPTAKEAAIAYNEAAVKYHGEFANLNKID